MTREEAIKIVKSNWPEGRHQIKEALETLIPELAESEDERIRKELLAVINDLILPDEQKTRFNAYLEKQKEQKPAEWSEADEEMLDAMIDIVSNSLYEPLCPREGMLAWLKSLRPQPHWKPSEEQIDALERAIVKTHTVDDIGILAELRDNLKKL